MPEGPHTSLARQREAKYPARNERIMARHALATLLTVAAVLGCVHFVARAVNQWSATARGEPLPAYLPPSQPPPHGAAIAEAAPAPEQPLPDACPPRSVWQPVLARFRQAYSPDDIAAHADAFAGYLMARAQTQGRSGQSLVACYSAAERTARDEVGYSDLPVAPGVVVQSPGRWTLVLFLFYGPRSQRPAIAEARCYTVDEMAQVVTRCE